MPVFGNDAERSSGGARLITPTGLPACSTSQQSSQGAGLSVTRAVARVSSRRKWVSAQSAQAQAGSPIAFDTTPPRIPRQADCKVGGANESTADPAIEAARLRE